MSGSYCAITWALKSHRQAATDRRAAFSLSMRSRQLRCDGAIKCQQISGGDGYSTMSDGNQTSIFSFGPLSRLANIADDQPGTVSPR